MKKRRIAAWASGGIVAVALAIAVAVPLTGTGTQASAANAGLDGCDNTGITSLVVAHGNDGQEIDPASLDGGSYDGYMFELKDDAPAALASASTLDEFEGRITYHEASGLYSADSLQSIDAFVDEQYIDHIEPDYVVEVADVDEDDLEGAVDAKDNSSTPNDPKYSDQWNFTQMNVSGAWEKGLYGQKIDKSAASNVKVAIVDSGIVGSGGSQQQHEDLDYSHVLEGVNLVDSTSGTPDTLGHGTFIAGLIAAKNNNGLGISGIAPEVDLYPVRIFGSTGRCATSTVVEGIYQAVEAGADVINLSLGSEYSSTDMEEACQAAVNSGAIVVAAAGNDGVATNNYPAAYDCVVGVASTDQDETPSYYSNYGTDNVWVAAPGAKVTSLLNTFSNGQSQYTCGSGTSYSTPEVVALGALSKSVFADFTQSDFKELLKDTSTDKGAVGYDQYYGWGIVNFGEAARVLMERSYVPWYYMSFNLTDQDSAALEGATLKVEAADDITWEDDSSAGITAGTWPKGTVIEPSSDGTYLLHKGTYKYTVTCDGYFTKTGTVNTYMEHQTEYVTVERSFGLTVSVVDTAGDELDDAVIALERTSDGLAATIKQGSDGRYVSSLPSGTYKYKVAVEGYETSIGYLTVDNKDLGTQILMHATSEVCYVSFDLHSGTVDGEVISGATVRVEDSKGNVVPAMEDGRYQLARGSKCYYTATRPGFEDQTGKFTVDDAADQTVSVAMTPAEHYAQLKAVDAKGIELEAAEVELKDASGNVVDPVKTSAGKYNLSTGTYAYTANCAGYGMKSGSFTIGRSDSYREITIVLNPATVQVDVKVRTQDDAAALESAVVSVFTLQGDCQVPAAGDVQEGVASSYNLAVGKYRCYASANGYKLGTEEFEVTANDSAKSVDLKLEQGEDASSGFSGGKGTEQEPYLITTETQLRSIAANKELLSCSFRLLNDIALGDEAWTPIGNYESDEVNAFFTGSFDGAGHTVSNLKANVSSGYAGFFGAVKSATIQNLVVQGSVYNTAEKGAGGIAGGIFNVTTDSSTDTSTHIINCEFKGAVTAKLQAGGIVGYAYSKYDSDKINIYIENCAHTVSNNTESIRAYDKNTSSYGEYAGGIVGKAHGIKVYSCYNTSDVSGGNYVGGIAGMLGANAGTYSCYSVGAPQVLGSSTSKVLGGIAGQLKGTIKNCYWLAVNGVNANAGVSESGAVNPTSGKKDAASMKQATFADALNLCDDKDQSIFVAVSGAYPKFVWQQ